MPTRRIEAVKGEATALRFKGGKSDQPNNSDTEGEATEGGPK
jgi:hypothetical protein